jgi:uncharacterized membrane protein
MGYHFDMDLLFLLCAGASLVLSGALAWKGRGRGSLPGCGNGSPCAALTTGRWSRVGSVRVVNLGVIVYFCMFATGMWRFIVGTIQASPVAIDVLAAASAIAVGSALWFILLQGAIARLWCPWCTLTHVLAFAGGVIALRSVGIDQSAALPIAIGTTAVVALVLGQIVLKPKLYAVVHDVPRHTQAAAENPPGPAASAAPPAKLELPEEPTVPASPAEQPAGASSTGATPVAPTAQSRPETFVNGRVALDANNWPVLGPLTARHLVVDLFDYTCDQCRSLHGHLLRVRERYPDDIAVIMVPVPQDVRCNRFLKRQNPHHVNACDYAMYALAVWLTEAEKFSEYDRWLFEPAHVPGLEEARAMAETMVGPDRFAQTLATASVDRRVREAIDFYMSAGAGPLPQLLLRNAALLGQVPSFEIVCDVLERQLGLGKNSGPRRSSPVPPAPPVQLIRPAQPARSDVYIINIDPNQPRSGS